MWSSYDAWMHFLGFKISTDIHCHFKAWKSQDFFLYNSDSICLKEKKSYTRMAWGWVSHGVIFIFRWTIPLNSSTLQSFNLTLSIWHLKFSRSEWWTRWRLWDRRAAASSHPDRGSRVRSAAWLDCGGHRSWSRGLFLKAVMYILNVKFVLDNITVIICSVIQTLGLSSASTGMFNNGTGDLVLHFIAQCNAQLAETLAEQNNQVQLGQAEWV